VVQNDIGNRYSLITIVAAITSKLSPTPFPVEVTVTPDETNGLSLPSAVNLGQIRSVDRTRLVRRLGKLDYAAMTRVDEALHISLGLLSCEAIEHRSA
jgi:mRNA interferase MazF